MKRFLSILLVCFLIISVGVIGVAASNTATEAFDYNEIRSAVLLVDTSRVMGLGHTAIILVDSAGRGIYYSFHNSIMVVPFGRGDSDRIVLTAAQAAQVFQDGLIPGDTRGYQYNQIIQFEVLPSEGLAMFQYAESIERWVYNAFAGLIPLGEQCDTVVRNILSAGGRRYRFFTIGLPIMSFNAMRRTLRQNSIPYTVHLPA